MNWNNIWKASMLVCMILIAGGATVTGIKHAVTVSNGTVGNPDTQWNADHIINGSVLPDTTSVYDLGSLTLLWNDIFALGLRVQQLRALAAYEYILFRDSTGNTRVVLSDLNGTGFKLYPNTTNTGSLGDATHLWADIYATNLHSSSGGAQYIEKASETSVLDSVGIVADVAWTTLDLTASTSANTKVVYLRLELQATVVGGGNYALMMVRCNGKVTPYFGVSMDTAGTTAGNSVLAHVFCAVDASQIIEYSVDVTAGWTVRAVITVLGYWE